jgi:hypothetical protein
VDFSGVTKFNTHSLKAALPKSHLVSPVRFE